VEKNLYHPHPGHPRTLTEFVEQHLGLCAEGIVEAVVKALDAFGLRRRIYFLCEAYRTCPESFGPFREYRNRVWRMLVVENPDVDEAVRKATGWKASEPILPRKN